jgi:hypothetical protein
VRRYANRTARVTVSATREDVARAVLALATRDAVEPLEPEDDATLMGFWYMAARGPNRTVRSVDVAPWPSIRRNYPRRVATALDELMGMTSAAVSGRIVLLHGSPGTGKTTALRALAHAWRRWCQLDYVLDPEVLLNTPSYLLDVVMGHDAEDDEPGRWRLLILEDCDELIGADAKQSSGQTLSRLLNLTDGLLGQGCDLLVALTTNEPLSRLHPAVIRPGRCLAEIEMGRFPRGEAADWLGHTDGIGPEGATLAELFQLQGAARKVEGQQPTARPGQYL